MILSLDFRFDASKMCDWCHGTCNTVTCYNHHTMNYSECFQIILWMRLLSAGCITTPARQWPGPRPDSGARPDSQTWCWNQEEDDCLVSILLQRIFSPCISGFHSPKNTRVKFGHSLRITAYGSVMIHQQQMSQIAAVFFVFFVN